MNGDHGLCPPGAGFRGSGPELRTLRKLPPRLRTNIESQARHRCTYLRAEAPTLHPLAGPLVTQVSGGLTRVVEKLSAQRPAHVETRLIEPIQNWRYPLNKPARLGVLQDSEQAGDLKAKVYGLVSPTLLVDCHDRMLLERQGNRLRLTSAEPKIGHEVLDMRSIRWSTHDQPTCAGEDGRISTGRNRFVPHSRANNNRAEDLAEQQLAANAGQAEQNACIYDRGAGDSSPRVPVGPRLRRD